MQLSGPMGNWGEIIDNVCLILPFSCTSIIVPLLNHPVAEEKGEDADRGKEPPEDWIWARS